MGNGIAASATFLNIAIDFQLFGATLPLLKMSPGRDLA